MQYPHDGEDDPRYKYHTPPHIYTEAEEMCRLFILTTLKHQGDNAWMAVDTLRWKISQRYRNRGYLLRCMRPLAILQALKENDIIESDVLTHAVRIKPEHVGGAAWKKW